MKIAVIILVVLVLVILGIWGYFGGFSRLSTKVEVAGGEILAYEKVTGDYKNSGKVSDRVYYSLLNDLKIETYKGVGIYYDKPGTIETSKLRSDIGCFIEERDRHRVEELKKFFEVKEMEREKYLIIEIPYRGPLSVFIGMIKAYPALEKESLKMNISEKNPVTEICDVPNKKIIYRKAIN